MTEFNTYQGASTIRYIVTFRRKLLLPSSRYKIESMLLKKDKLYEEMPRKVREMRLVGPFCKLFVANIVKTKIFYNMNLSLRPPLVESRKQTKVVSVLSQHCIQPLQADAGIQRRLVHGLSFRRFPIHFP
jgi:hypothetical protein